jgi:ATPase subunit of ABC transporter with duplicated ATPase domains
VAKWILELDNGRGYPYSGNYSGWLEQKKKRLAVQEKQESARQKQLDRELEWAKSSPRARMTKSKARLANLEKLQEQVIDEDEKELVIQIPSGPPLGDLVVRAEGLKKGFGDVLLYDDMTFNLPKGGIVGIIGPNGAGKTTLFKMIVGQEKPDGGTLTVGPTVKVAHVDQNRDALNDKNSIFEEVTGGTDYIMLGKQRIASRAYCAKFNFRGPDQQKLVGSCSGGERNRIHLAKLLRSGGNLLLLDEPTNDLDVDTLRALEEALTNFSGCAVVISHDRWFLDRIATHILAFEGDSKVVWCEGNFGVYEEQRRARLGPAADLPTRIKYRKLTS